MNAHLTRLGISLEIQAFFNLTGDLCFYYGDEREYYTNAYHKVPTTQNLWVAGSEGASQVIVTYSAMEAIAFITLHRQRYPNLEQLVFIAIGNKLQAEQIEWIRHHYHNRRFTLVFSDDLLGRITSIKLAAGLKGWQVRILHKDPQVMIYRQEELYVFSVEQLSLYAFREAFRFRSRIRTRKPSGSTTFLDQLKNDMEK